ncbi:MAG: phosphonate metabolism transcriptional regulator PhnF [Anaerolineae bacterium]
MERNESIPYYEQIRAYLIAEIEAGTFPPHTKIPSERNLCTQFGVSRMTVKHAIQELVSNGRLYTRVGKGTFVSEPPITQQLNTLTGFSQDMEVLRKSTSSHVLRAEVVEAGGHVATQLQIAPDHLVTFLKRLRLADNQPVALESSYLNNRYCKDILDHHDFSTESLYTVLREEYGLTLKYAEQSIKARLASPKEAKQLNVAEGFPMLHITRVTFMDENVPLEYVESVYRGDRYIFRARLTNI